MYKILLTKKANKELNSLPKKERVTILYKISQLTIPLPNFLSLRKLSGMENGYRLRVGKIRVIFEIDSDSQIVWIRKIAYRKDAYKFLLA